MNEAIIELKQKASSIDNVVRELEKDVAVIKNTLDINFTNITNTLSEIKDSINSLKTPVNKLSDQMIEANKDIQELKTKQNEAVTNKKWIATTVIATLGLIGTVVKLIIG
jgi:chromosome segregation ATPase